MAAVIVRAAVEGLLDEAVVGRLMMAMGAAPGPVYGRNGKDRVRTRIDGYNRAARWVPWVVLVDLNHEAACATSPAPSVVVGARFFDVLSGCGARGRSLVTGRSRAD